MKILFVCTGNTCRSPMAQALMESLAAKKGILLQCDSAGLYANPGSPVSETAREVLEICFHIPNFSHPAQTVSPELLEESDLVVAMTENHRRLLLQTFGGEDKIITLPGEVGDPFGGSFSLYEETAKEILAGLEKLMEEGVIHG